MNEAETLRDEYDCTDIEYLGDGLYAGFDGWQIWLCCRRDNRMHAVAMEPAVYRKFKVYAEETPA